MRKYFLLILLIAVLNTLVFSIISAQVYKTDVSGVKYEVRKGHLDLGGKSIIGETIEINNFYIERNGKPFFPVVGEFHYSRYPNQYWDEEILKIKAGGITVIATYVFWNLHEPKEGFFEWEGDLNLRKFVELCKENDMEVIVRIGPFAHGEIRNGGLPDWLYGRPFEVRSNDSVYLSYAKKLYNKIGDQLKGLYFKDNGPIIGIQLENEYQHSAAPWSINYAGAQRESTVARFDRKITQVGVGINEMGNDRKGYGLKHMQTLKMFAKEAGMEVPVYTATGWGYATIAENGSIPVMAGYAYPFWQEKISPSPFYLFKNIHKYPDYSPVSYVSEDYPSLAAELGTGMCVTYSRRPRVPGESFLPMMVRTVGSGSNGLGYYMYHGGTTPSNGFFLYSEGFGLNLKSYDYQSPIREFGQTGKGFYGLKVINYFLQHFGDVLAPLYPVIPSTNEGITPDNTTTLRYSIRTDGDKGFIFMHNFQDHIKTVDLKDLKIQIKTNENLVTVPENGTFVLKDGSSAIFPFNLTFGDLTFRYATVQPLCILNNSGKKHYVFFSIDGIEPEIVLNGSKKVHVAGAKISEVNGNTIIKGDNKNFGFSYNGIQYLIINFKDALNSYITGESEKQFLVISESLILEKNNKFEMISYGKESWNVNIYPTSNGFIADKATVSKVKTPDKLFSVWNVKVDKIVPEIKLTQYDDRHYVLDAKKLDLAVISDVFIKFDYIGDRGICMLNGELITDNLYTSEPWVIALKRYVPVLKEKEMYFYFLPMLKDAPYISYLDNDVVPDFTDKKEYLEINQPEVIVEYKVSSEIK